MPCPALHAGSDVCASGPMDKLPHCVVVQFVIDERGLDVADIEYGVHWRLGHTRIRLNSMHPAATFRILPDLQRAYSMFHCDAINEITLYVSCSKEC